MEPELTELIAYARGYYDGRVANSRVWVGDAPERVLRLYKIGYETGESDRETKPLVYVPKYRYYQLRAFLTVTAVLPAESRQKAEEIFEDQIVAEIENSDLDAFPHLQNVALMEITCESEADSKDCL